MLATRTKQEAALAELEREVVAETEAAYESLVGRFPAHEEDLTLLEALDAAGSTARSKLRAEMAESSSAAAAIDAGAAALEALDRGPGVDVQETLAVRGSFFLALKGSLSCSLSRGDGGVGARL